MFINIQFKMYLEYIKYYINYYIIKSRENTNINVNYFFKLFNNFKNITKGNKPSLLKF